MSDQAVAEQSVEDRLVGFLNAEDGIEEEPKEVESQADENTEEVEEVAESEDSQEEPEEPVKLKLTRNGEEVEVDLDEAKNLAQMGYDYTKKTQEVAEQRKAVEMQAQAVKAQEQALKQMAETQQAFIKEIAKVEAINEQTAQYEALDWATLTDTDPVQAQKLWIQYQQLQTKRTRAVEEINQKHAQLNQQRELQQQARLAEAHAELLKAFPNWNAEFAGELRESGKQYGFTEQELSSVSDPRQVKLLADAAAYRKLQSQKTNVDKKVTGKPPVVKPGTKDQKATTRTVDANLRAQLRKTGDQHAAAKLIERML